MYSYGSSLSFASSGFLMDFTELETLLSSSWSDISLDSVDSFTEFLAVSLSSGFSGLLASLSKISELSLLAVTAVIGVYSGLIV